MVLHQHKAAKFRTEMACNPDWQWSEDRPPVGRYPAFSLVTGRTYRNHQVLHQKGFVTLEARLERNLGLEHLLFNADAGRDLAPARTSITCRRFRRRGTLVHAAWLDPGAAL